MLNFYQKYRQYFMAIGNLFLLGLMLTQVVTCQSKNTLLSECDRIREVREKPYTTPEVFSENSNNIDPKKMIDRAEELSQRTKEMQAVDIKDENLKRYQNRYIKLYNNEAKSLREWAQVTSDTKPTASQNVPPKIDASIEKMDKLTKGIEYNLLLQDILEQKIFLIDGLQGYCNQ